MPGWRISISPAHWKQASHIDCGCRPTVEQFHDAVASLVPKSPAAASSSICLRRLGVDLAVLPVGANFSRQLHGSAAGTVGVAIALGRVARLRARAARRRASAGPARRAASRCSAACASCWRRRSPCGRCRGNRARRSGRKSKTSLRSGRARQRRDRGIGCGLVPVVHRLDEGLRAPGRASGTAASSTGAIVQLPSCTSRACDDLN